MLVLRFNSLVANLCIVDFNLMHPLLPPLEKENHSKSAERAMVFFFSLQLMYIFFFYFQLMYNLIKTFTNIKLQLFQFYSFSSWWRYQKELKKIGIFLWWDEDWKRIRRKSCRRYQGGITLKLCDPVGIASFQWMY